MLATIAGLALLFIGGLALILRARLSLHGALTVLSVFFLSGFWAGGSVYLVNKHADDSAPVWSTTRVTDLRTSHEKTGTSYRVRVAPWTASTEPVELHVSHETYDSLRVGMNVEVSVRRGAQDARLRDEVRICGTICEGRWHRGG